MDFATRDRYRHVVESIARNSGLAETVVAESVLSLARRYKEEESSEKKRHVGYYLVGKGQEETAMVTGIGNRPAAKLVRTAQKVPLLLYIASIAW